MGITSVLIAGLIITAGGAVETQRERAVEGELTTIGERIATELTALDRVADPTNSTMTVETSHPERVVNSRYRVRLTSDSGDCRTDTCLVLESRAIGAPVVVPVRDDIDTVESTAFGGEIRLVHNGTAVRMERSQP
ncbi:MULTISPECIES: hypothetical protein [Halorubrum]|nr:MULTISPECIES: hypothetical protein [Halorubrum]RLM51691.1 hypothetical protein DVK06_04635 [Halorubrum sp. Atlit-28R]TKX41570.1 hypothetical protein EXE50_15835 [Halorubrum sp. ARQ200]TKX49177.1 hypothetical protein EXE49_13235 [Halorubrum sp. ASP121]TKX60857.1 hypothetical protein EXE48_10530 [Halorubrum sp. ASP1]